MRHPGGALEGERCGQEGELAQGTLLIWFEQVPAPADSRLDRLMARNLPVAATQDGQAPRYARCDVVHRQRPRPGRGKLNTQWNTIKRAAQVDRSGGLSRVQLGLTAASPAEQANEQFDRVA